MVGSSTLVGRDAELSRLRRALDGETRLLLVTGDAGVGKTRFVGEGLRRAANDGVVVGAGGCLPLSEQLPLLPLVDILHALSQRDSGRLFEAALAAAPDYARVELARLMPRQRRTTTGVPGGRGEGWRRERLFWGVTELLDQMGRHRRLCLLIEDVHWADGATLDFVTYLTRPGHSPPYTVVATCRSDETPQRHVLDWLIHVRRTDGMAEIQLGPLTRAQVAQQVAELAGGEPPKWLVDRLYERAEGNPFFTEQLVAVALARSATGLQTANAELPSGLAGLLLERARRCGENSRRVLDALAVAARALSEDTLDAITGLGANAVTSALRELTAARLLSSGAAGDEHRLRHALLAEAVAADLLPGERRALHVATARALEAAGDDTFAAEIAAHWAAARHLPEELRATVAAGEVAERLFAYAQAAAHWQRAIEIIRLAPQTAQAVEVDEPQLFGRAVDALEASGDGVGANAVAQEADRRFADHPDRWTRAVIHARAAHFRGIYSPAEALPMIEEALRLFDGGPPSADLAQALFDHYRFCVGDGRPDAGRASLDKALEVAQRAGASALVPRILSFLAHDRMERGQIGEASELSQRAWEDAEASGNNETILWLAGNESDTLLKAGRLADATTVALRGLEAAEQIGRDNDFNAFVVVVNAVEALLGQGRSAEAAPLVDPRTAGPPDGNTRVLHMSRAELDLLRGDAEAAVRRLDEIKTLPVQGYLEVAREIGQRSAEVALWRGRPAEARTEVEQLLARLEDTNEVILCGWLLVLGRRACADVAERARALRDATGLGSALESARWLDAWLERMAGAPLADHPFVATIPADRASWEAEGTRLAGRSEPPAWSAAAKTWDGLGRPHRAAYAWWRQAEAVLLAGHPSAEAAAALRSAEIAAVGHSPLLAEIRGLALRGRIPLGSSAPGSPAPQQDTLKPHGLTERELVVLRLLGRGRTNAEIGTELFISPKTASVHVTNILRKLGVSNRVQAATVAQRAGLLEDRPAAR